MASLNTIHDSVQVEPLKQWPTGHERTPEEDRRSSQFKSKEILKRTTDDLKHELRQLDVEAVVIQVEVPEGQIRQRDGMPYKRADVDPGVVVTLEMEGGGVQTYPCDTFETWSENLRAIALTLRDLRRIGRYGVGKGSEQYRGYTALPENVDDRVGPPEAAQVLLRTAQEVQSWTSDEAAEDLQDLMLSDQDYANRVARKALGNCHPDRPGGTQAHFVRVKRARDVLDEYHRKGETGASRISGSP